MGRFRQHQRVSSPATKSDELAEFQRRHPGHAAVALAGVIAGLRLTGGKLSEQKLLFLGAGEAGTGIADLYVAAAMSEGLTEAEARHRCWFVDSKGLVVQSRAPQLAEHKLHYAHEHAFIPTLAEAVTALKPTALIGVSGMPQTFTKEIVETMSALNRRPIIFALSNPTSKAECTAEQAYTWSEGRGRSSRAAVRLRRWSSTASATSPVRVTTSYLPRSLVRGAGVRSARGHRCDVPRGGADARRARATRISPWAAFIRR